MPEWYVVVVAALVVGVVALIVFAGVVRRATRVDGYGITKSSDTYDIDSADEPVAAAESIEARIELSMRFRIRIFGYAVAAFFGALATRLWGMQLLSGDAYASRAEQNRTREVSIRAPRGRILDRNGEVLVENRLSIALTADRTVADDVRLVRRLSNLLGMPEVAIRHNVMSTVEGAQSLRTIMLDVPDTAVAYVVEHPSQFPGISVESRSVRYYPHGPLACHLLGYTGTISADELAAFRADEDALVEYQSGDVVGKAGVELRYESVLQGVRGTRTVHVDAGGDVMGVVGEVPAVPGSDVRLTIDSAIQKAAEHAIGLGYTASQFKGGSPTGGACVCIDCKSGEVLALASDPGYDPSSFIGGISSSAWAQLISDEANTPLLNRVTEGLYPSASTIKPLTASAALEAGVADDKTTFECTGWWTGLGEEYGMYCWDHDGHGVLDLHEGITNSCDAVFYEIAKSFYYSNNPEGIQSMYRRWGLGSRTGIDLPGEYAGRIPDARWKWEWYTWADEIARTWQGGDTANIAIGQGDVLVTPLQMCYVYCGLVNGGVEMWPHVMLDVISGETHRPLFSNDRRPQQTVLIDPKILEYVRKGMWGVVNETASEAYFDGLPVQVMGKSGTGEAGDDPDHPHAWFIAAAPADDPRYVVASLIEHGGWGSQVASHVCRHVLAAIYGADEQDPVDAIRRVEALTGGEMRD